MRSAEGCLASGRFSCLFGRLRLTISSFEGELGWRKDVRDPLKGISSLLPRPFDFSPLHIVPKILNMFISADLAGSEPALPQRVAPHTAIHFEMSEKATSIMETKTLRRVNFSRLLTRKQLRAKTTRGVTSVGLKPTGVAFDVLDLTC